MNPSIIPALSLAPLFIGQCCYCFPSNSKSCFQQWDEQKEPWRKTDYIILDLEVTLNFSADLCELSENNWKSRLGAQKIKIEGKQEEIYESWKTRRRNKDRTLCCATTLQSKNWEWRWECESCMIKKIRTSVLCGPLQADRVCTAPGQSDPGRSDVFSYTNVWSYPMKFVFYRSAQLPSR